MLDSISVVNVGEGDFGRSKVKFFSLDIRSGAHANAQFQMIVEKAAAMEKIQKEICESSLRLVAQNGNSLFQGIIQRIFLQEENHYMTVHGELVSGTILLDTKVKSRSFQDTAMTYQEIIEQVLKDTPDAGAIFAAGEFDRPIGKPIIQYRETDWQFINRLASRCKSCIIPDVSQPKPWFYFGVKQKGEHVVFDEVEYRQTVSENYYLMGAGNAGWRKGDYYQVDVESTQNYDIGDTTVFKSRSLIICEKSASYARNEVMFSYRLAQAGYNQAKRYDNQKIAGMALLGAVLETAGERLKIHLDIDPSQELAKAYAYPWAPPSGNLMYLMPEVGTRVSLYFPDGDEQHARAINCVRTNGGAEGTCPMMGNFEERCLTTKYGKQMYFHPGSMGLIGGGGSISQTDQSGTVVQSKLPVKIYAKDEIKIIAPDVTLQAKSELTVVQGGE